MATMYEMIMDLPLFKGLSHEQVSAFLEKTHVDFKKYENGEIIVDSSDRVATVKCVISGKISVLHRLGQNGTLRVAEVLEGGNVIGADRMFGMDTDYGCVIKAVGQVSVMEFSKDQYFGLLTTGNIFLLNYLNYLSLRAQRLSKIYSTYPSGNIGETLMRFVESVVSRQAVTVAVYFDLNELSAFMHLTPAEISEMLDRLVDAGAVKRIQQGLMILDKEKLVES